MVTENMTNVYSLKTIEISSLADVAISGDNNNLKD